MTAYYNENDEKAAATLRELISRGLIAPGDVDERSILDVRPVDVAGYTQCHFFAGFGVWSYAARLAGWPDGRPLWTGSCPCQPFSAAGKGGGFDDERHLWPAFHWLICQCKPAIVLGEQVASKDGLAWLDLVLADLEGADYTVGAADLCAAGFGSPHIRQRLWWVGVADAELPAQSRQRHVGGPGLREQTAMRSAGDRLADGLEGNASHAGVFQEHAAHASGGMADATRQRQCSDEVGRDRFDGIKLAGTEPWSDRSHDGATGRPGPTNGFWGNVDWIGCRDNRWRPVEPGTFPLAHGYPERVGILRGAGNAIVAPVAQGFIEAVMECVG